MYGRKAAKSDSIAKFLGSRAIKGVGALSVGKYVGHIEGDLFVTLPQGMHKLTPTEMKYVLAAGVVPKDRIDITIGHSDGFILGITPNGQFVATDARKKKWITKPANSLDECLSKVVELKIKPAEIIVEEILHAGKSIYKLSSDADSEAADSGINNNG